MHRITLKQISFLTRRPYLKINNALIGLVFQYWITINNNINLKKRNSVGLLHRIYSII